MMLLPAGLWRSRQILKGHRPDLVIGVGGYASGPVMAIAGLMRIRRVLVEPNAIPGLTNRFLAPWVDRIYLSFDETRGWLKRGVRAGAIRVFGNPVRADILSAGERRPDETGRKTVLIMGGSQGSRAINHGMADALPGLEAWKSKIRIVHQSGEYDVVWLKEKYSQMGFDAAVVPFLSPVSEAYRAADLVLCRSGATTVAELTACGRPAILVPYPYATHGHQERNARALSEAGAAELLLERDLTGKGLAAMLDSLLADPVRLAKMAEASRRLGRPDAAEKIVNDCLQLLGA
jgi:UDP-N-acetylglucosamine--N-acetylmuramyl-(pentapeptide) pyrophosphoryl-undecaprenol N-acetylglucosamine transferase